MQAALKPQTALKPLRLVTNQPTSELERLFQEHHGRVFRTAQRITGSPADAEDVLQTVFLRLVKGQDDYDWSGNPEAYLSRAAINASLDLLRSRKRAKAVAIDDTLLLRTMTRKDIWRRKRRRMEALELGMVCKRLILESMLG